MRPLASPRASFLLVTLALGCAPSVAAKNDETTSSSTGAPCVVGQVTCNCTPGGGCDPGLQCIAGLCIPEEPETDSGVFTASASTVADSSSATTDDPTAASVDSSTGPLGKCGDRVVDPGEECDLGGSDLNCDEDCTFPVCGDDLVNNPAGEECDPGATDETALCNNDCTLSECGDALVNGADGEECDDGKESAACDDDCTLVSCGDGITNDAAGEFCDDANDIPDDGCDSCFPECGNDCFGDEGCVTNAGRCIRFTCADGADSSTTCDSCFGWQAITYDNWLQDGYCEDIIAIYRAVQFYEVMCGANAPMCCGGPNGCDGDDNGWHFSDGINNYILGPCLSCMAAEDCTYYNSIDNGGDYSRLTACERG